MPANGLYEGAFLIHNSEKSILRFHFSFRDAFAFANTGIILEL